MNNSRLFRLAVCLTLAGLTVPTIGKAQLAFDVSRVTCADLLAMPPDQSLPFTAWMSGYFNQRIGYKWIDFSAYGRNVANLKQWCTSHPDELVMHGLERATAK